MKKYFIHNISSCQTCSLISAKKNLSQLRQLYFKLKDRVFSQGRLGIAYNTASLDEVLKEEFGTEAIMTDVRHPKYVHQIKCGKDISACM